VLIERLGLTGVINLVPDADALAQRDESGLRWSYDPDGCCEIRKVAPLAKALARYDASITGRKGFQSATRAGLPRFEIDKTDTQGRLKINPLADWNSEILSAYLAEHQLPPHPLVAEGYPSIGCSPCTSKVAPGEDPRAGRWRGWEKTECGIHVPGQDDGIDELPPGFDPVF
jgi:phosphoadenosine phosphosulfate reductase